MNIEKNTMQGTIIGKGTVEASEGDQLRVIVDACAEDMKEKIRFIGTNGFVGYPDPKLAAFLYLETRRKIRFQCEVVQKNKKNTYRVFLIIID